MNKVKTLVVVGMGYVGLPLALLAEERGYKVSGIVKTSESAQLLNTRKLPIVDQKIEKKLVKSTIHVQTDYSSILSSGVVAICVPTPITKDNKPDLRALKEVSRNIGKVLKKGHLVILESTVNPGICDELVIPLLEKYSGLKVEVDFYFAHCPERINPGDSKWTVENIPRVLGASDITSLKNAYTFYNSILKGKITKMRSLKEAEAVKIVENTFRDINIAFVNELAISFSKIGIDATRVIDAAATKPFAFMAHYPGCGVGGHCIPVDPYYLISYAKSKGFNHKFLKLARSINNHMPEFTVQLLKEALVEKKIHSSAIKVGLLGLSYKANIDDIRESPSFEIIEELKKNKISYIVFDPYVPRLSDYKSLDETLSECTILIIATNHKEFCKKLTAEYLSEKKISIIIDGRNCLDMDKIIEKGIIYRGIGR